MPTCPFRLLSMGLSIVLTAAMGLQTLAAESPNEKAAEDKAIIPGQLILDDAPLPISGNHDQDEVRRDKLEALALFSAGRAEELRQQFAEALRSYQRISLRPEIGRNRPVDHSTGHSSEARERGGALRAEGGGTGRRRGSHAAAAFGSSIGGRSRLGGGP